MHYSNTSNPVDFPVIKYVHIVQVHPVELGEPNLHKVKAEKEFDTKAQADWFINYFNGMMTEVLPSKAVYHGRVNLDTGELQ